MTLTTQSPEYYKPGAKGYQRYKTVEKLLQDRLSIPGQIRAREAWKLNKTGFPQSVFAIIFKLLMENMILEGRAVRTCKWTYNILAGNNIQKNIPGQAETTKKERTWFSNVYKCELSI